MLRSDDGRLRAGRGLSRNRRFLGVHPPSIPHPTPADAAFHTEVAEPERARDARGRRANALDARGRRANALDARGRRANAVTPVDGQRTRYLPGSTPNSSVWPKPTSAPAAAIPAARASSATAAATAGATSRLNTEGMM